MGRGKKSKDGSKYWAGVCLMFLRGLMKELGGFGELLMDFLLV